jgi:hypothetical protein
MGTASHSNGSSEPSRNLTDAYFQEWWDLCERDVVHLSDASARRSLTKDEVHSAQTLIDIMARVDANQKNKGWLYRAKRRTELMRQFFKQQS